MKQYLMSSMWVIGLLAAPVLTAETLDWPVGEFVPYELKSGELDNPDQERAPVYMETVHVAGAAWLRLYFREVDLPPGSVLRMTSERDQEVQELDAAGIRMWNNTSAYFNGDTVHVELIAGPGTVGNKVVLDRVAMEMGNGGEDAGGCGICGNDDRVPSDEDFTGRIMPVGCTGSIWNENSCLVSAGHCVGSDDVIQFRVPDSDPNCDLNHPPVADQFPITGRRFRNAGIGRDWSVMTTGTNNLGETAYERFGDLRRIATDVADVGDPIAVWGFAVDVQCTRYQTQQTDDGNITARFGTYYEMNADVTFGSSGSGLIWNNQIIGIITNCPCPGKCTRVDNSDFVDARDELCPSGPPICIVHGVPGWDRDDPNTWASFVDHAFSAYIDNKVESTDGNSRDLGLTRWDVVFNTAPFGDAAGGPITTANVSVSVTGGAAPGVASLTKSGNVLTVTLDAFMPLQHWTTLDFQVWNGDGQEIEDIGNEGENVDECSRLDVGTLPSDVNNDGQTQPLDLSREIASFSAGDPFTMLPDAHIRSGSISDYFDISRDGLFQPIDIGRVIAALNGSVPFTQNWNGVGMNSAQP